MKKQSSPFNIKNSVIGLFTGFINGVFGSGGGTLLVPILNNILKVEEHKSHSTALAIIIFLSTTSSIIYISKGTFDMGLTLQAAVGSIIGGIIGAKLLIKVNGKFLRISITLLKLFFCAIL